MKTRNENFDVLFSSQFQELQDQELSNVVGGMTVAQRTVVSSSLYFLSIVTEAAVYPRK